MDNFIATTFCSVTLIIVSCLHLGQNSGKFSSTVSGRTLIRVLLLQIGHSTHFSFTNAPPPHKTKRDFWRFCSEVPLCSIRYYQDRKYLIFHLMLCKKVCCNRNSTNRSYNCSGNHNVLIWNDNTSKEEKIKALPNSFTHHNP